jgi:hypothetical protein
VNFDVEVDNSRELISKFARNVEVEFVYITGSTAAGLANSTSDVDLIAVHHGSAVPQMEWSGKNSTTYHLEFLPLGVLESFLLRLEEIPFSSKEYSKVVSSQEICRRLSRLAIGIPVQGEDELRKAQNRISSSALRQLFLAYCGSMAATFVRDTVGALAAGDHLTAFESSNFALRWCGQMALAGVGDIFLGEKWLLRRLLRSERIPVPLAMDLTNLIYAGTNPLDETAVPLIERRLNTIGSLSSYCSIYGWNSEISSFPDYLMRSNGSCRHEQYSAIPFSDGVMLAGLNARVIPRVDAIVWLMAGLESTQERIGSRLANAMPTAKEDFFAKSMDRLNAQGLIQS